MARVVQYSRFGGPEVLEVVDIDTPAPGAGEVLVRVIAAGTNPVESAARSGAAPELWHVDLPTGQGRDLAGIVSAVGSGVSRFRVGDEVMGYVDHGSQATDVVVPEAQLAPKPRGVEWEIAGSLYVAGTTALDGVRDVALRPGDVVVITSAAGGVGGLAVQLAVAKGARVIGTVAERNFDYVRMLGATPVAYGADLASRIRSAAPNGVDAFIDFFGGNSVEVARELGVPSSRITTVLALDAVDEYGVQTATAGGLAEMLEIAKLMQDHQLRMPIADVFPLEDIVAAYTQLDRRESVGKIVIGMNPVRYRNQRTRDTGVKQQDVTLGVPTPHDQIDSPVVLPPVFGHRRGHAPTPPADRRPEEGA